jgi:hypothetical protein
MHATKATPIHSTRSTRRQAAEALIISTMPRPSDDGGGRHRHDNGAGTIDRSIDRLID